MKVQVTIDRFEDNSLVILEARGIKGVIEWPSELVPPESKEGDILSFEIKRDPKATQAIKNKLASRY